MTDTKDAPHIIGGIGELERIDDGWERVTAKNSRIALSYLIQEKDVDIDIEEWVADRFIEDLARYEETYWGLDKHGGMFVDVIDGWGEVWKHVYVEAERVKGVFIERVYHKLPPDTWTQHHSKSESKTTNRKRDTQ